MKDSSIKMITVTYGRSAITKGVDMPTITFVVVDVNQFLPQMAVSDIAPGMAKEEIRQKSIAHIRWNICQVIGRSLRSLLKRIPGVIQVDPRQIVVLLHGLPIDLMDFELDEKVLHVYREYRNDFVSSLSSYVVESVCDAAVDCKAGNDPVQRIEIDRQIIMDKALEKGIDSLSHIERHLLNLENRAELRKWKSEKKHGSLEQKIIEAAQAKGTWNPVYRKHHINRLSKREQTRLKKLFTQHIK